jgi:hypothetical protein
MNTNREKKVIQSKDTKCITTKVKFKNNTSISGILYRKDTEYEVDSIELIKEFIY